MSKERWYFVNESDAKSVLSDLVTFGLLFAGFYLNYQFIGNSVILQLVLGFSFFALAIGRANKSVKRMTRQQAKDYLCGEDDAS